MVICISKNIGDLTFGIALIYWSNKIPYIYEDILVEFY